jgi:hypothetical protein
MKTAEEILEEHRIDIHDSDLRDDIIVAMESYASERLRDELIKFLPYFQSLWECEKTGKTNTEIIDEYLKSKQ